MKNIFFSIIIPTFERPDFLIRAVKSVLNNLIPESPRPPEGVDLEIIIVNDSPDFDYTNFENYLRNSALPPAPPISPRWSSGEAGRRGENAFVFSVGGTVEIKYLKNTENSGVNFSRNLALKNISLQSDYIIFLDDDDWLNTNVLIDIQKELQNVAINWLITNRIKESGESLTKIKPAPNYSYFWDYLIKKNISGDATHVIKSEIAKKYNFSQKIRNGEEWFYFIQLPDEIIYKNLNSTISGGYANTGLNEKIKTNYKKNTKEILQEILNSAPVPPPTPTSQTTPKEGLDPKLNLTTCISPSPLERAGVRSGETLPLSLKGWTKIKILIYILLRVIKNVIKS